MTNGALKDLLGYFTTRLGSKKLQSPCPVWPQCPARKQLDLPRFSGGRKYLTPGDSYLFFSFTPFPLAPPKFGALHRHTKPSFVQNASFRHSALCLPLVPPFRAFGAYPKPNQSSNWTKSGHTFLRDNGKYLQEYSTWQFLLQQELSARRGKSDGSRL